MASHPIVFDEDVLNEYASIKERLRVAREMEKIVEAKRSEYHTACDDVKTSSSLLYDLEAKLTTREKQLKKGSLAINFKNMLSKSAKNQIKLQSDREIHELHVLILAAREQLGVCQTVQQHLEQELADLTASTIPAITARTLLLKFLNSTFDTQTHNHPQSPLHQTLISLLRLTTEIDTDLLSHTTTTKIIASSIQYLSKASDKCTQYIVEMHSGGDYTTVKQKYLESLSLDARKMCEVGRRYGAVATRVIPGLKDKVKQFEQFLEGEDDR
ncbi:hypothetical protein HDU97_008910 [Phlyctochytrium planicorne]|nr:hypothetical protein HDU97_008910 [Phlyctochytrium planicorne]